MGEREWSKDWGRTVARTNHWKKRCLAKLQILLPPHMGVPPSSSPTACAKSASPSSLTPRCPRPLRRRALALLPSLSHANVPVPLGIFLQVGDLLAPVGLAGWLFQKYTERKANK
jgi:hypothetical protein